MTSVKRPRTPSQSSTSSNPSSPTASTYSLTSSYNHYPSHKYTRIVPNTGSLSPRSIDGTSTSSGSTIKLATTGAGSALSATRHPLLCTLPPTCHRHPTPIADTNDLERHYATYHAHVCGVKGCGCVFPDERLLELVSVLSMGIYLISSFYLLLGFGCFFFFRVSSSDQRWRFIIIFIHFSSLIFRTSSANQENNLAPNGVSRSDSIPP